MSVAFTREDSAETASELELPDRPVSAHPNLVTPAGLQALEAALASARAAHDAAQAIEDVNERRRASAPAVRDMRYYSERLRTAHVIAPPQSHAVVAFGARVTFARDDGRRQSFRIVGEDEADPREGSMSYVAPVARVLMGKPLGAFVPFGDHEIEIVAIE